MNKIAIVILNWNGRQYLERFLPSVVMYSTYPHVEIVVIDNASTDTSLEFLSTTYPTITRVVLDKNYGFTGGYNKGVQHIDADYAVFLNSDVEVTANWLDKPIEHLHTHPNTVAVQPKILSFENRAMFEFAGASGGYIDFLGYPFCRGRIISEIEQDNGQYNKPIPIFWASGACFFIRSSVYKELNGFDEDFFAHMEEIDLCWRLNNANRKVYYCGESTVYHLGGATLQKSNPKKAYLNYRNSLWMNLKNLPKNKLFPMLFTRLSMDGIAAIAFLPTQGFPHLWAVYLSHMHFYGGFFKMYKKRTQNQLKKYSDKALLPVQYFLQKRQYYKDLK